MWIYQIPSLFSIVYQNGLIFNEETSFLKIYQQSYPLIVDNFGCDYPLYPPNSDELRILIFCFMFLRKSLTEIMVFIIIGVMSTNLTGFCDMQTGIYCVRVRGGAES